MLGHEIAHGFDNIGRMFDKHGNFEEWWTSESNSVFQENAECIINQYSNYTIPELNGTRVSTLPYFIKIDTISVLWFMALGRRQQGP